MSLQQCIPSKNETCSKWLSFDYTGAIRSTSSENSSQQGGLNSLESGRGFRKLSLLH